jgi:Na+-driven multidrug efflux pump
VLRSEFDREITRLAVPALGALAAEPLPALADTAIIGHLGTTELAALALGARFRGRRWAVVGAQAGRV